MSDTNDPKPLRGPPRPLDHWSDFLYVEYKPTMCENMHCCDSSRCHTCEGCKNYLDEKGLS